MNTSKRLPPYKQNGLRYAFIEGERRCIGACMGRPNIVPPDYNGERLSLRRVPFVDGGYDQGGAYWGTPADLWCAWGETETEQMEIFVRANDRDAAKLAVRKAVGSKVNFKG